MREPGVAVFAYHSMGARVLKALLARKANIVAVVTHEDDPTEGDWFDSVEQIARTHSLPLFAPRTPNDPKFVEALRALAPDVILSLCYRRLLGPELLSIPPVAAVNLHGSLLPAYRGRAPINWALINGERHTGVTLHHMVAEPDAGDIVAQKAFDIHPEDTARTLYERVIQAGIGLVLEMFPLIITGRAPRNPQDHTRATVFPRRRPEDGKVEWTWPTNRIYNMIRALTHPYPGAFVGEGEKRLYLWAGSTLPQARSHLGPGILLEIRPLEGITVSTGDGAILISRVQQYKSVEEAADRWALRSGLHAGSLLIGP
jgi:methionyl-tRNA formyltransferase